jgi:hypothetical protein
MDSITVFLLNTLHNTHFKWHMGHLAIPASDNVLHLQIAIKAGVLGLGSFYCVYTGTPVLPELFSEPMTVDKFTYDEYKKRGDEDVESDLVKGLWAVSALVIAVAGIYITKKFMR